MSFAELSQEIKAGNISPVYYLYGQESYFLDKINVLIDQFALDESAKAFNREVFYGAESNAAQVLNACRSFPVMAPRKLVFLREAQSMNKKELEKFESYLKQPVESTCLVITFKDRNGFGKANHKLALDNARVLHSSRMYDRDVIQWLNDFLPSLGLEFEPGIPEILTANLGINLNLIENELDKMILYLKATNQQKLGKDLVYEMINVDKSFNVFELINAISKRDIFRSHMILDKMTQNLKNYPSVLTLSSLFRFFHHLALVHSAQLKDPNSIKHALGVNYYQAKDYAMATKHFSAGITHRNIRLIQEADQMVKGIVPSKMDQRHILKTLIWKLMS